MPTEPIAADDLLYHAVHGLCRVKAVNKPRSGDKLSYTLIPAATDNKMNICFTVPDKDLEASGFHAPVSLREANKIMEFLKSKPVPADVQELAAGKGSFPARSDAWGLVQIIQSSSGLDKLSMKDQRRRQLIEHSVKGLVGELSFVMKKTIREIVADIRKVLGNPAKMNPQIHVALARACED